MSKKKWLLILTVLASIVIGAGIAVAQDRYRKAAARGPYRAFLTKPVMGLGWKGGMLYREHEMLGAALNDLHEKGFVPFLAEMLTEERNGRRTDRLLIICRQQ